MSMLQLDPIIEMDTPRGRAFAHIMIDYAQNGNVVWGCVIRETGEWWWYQNPEVRHAPCETYGIRLAEIHARAKSGGLS